MTEEYRPPPQPHAAPYWIPAAPASRDTDGFCVAALVLGIVPVMAGLLAIVFGAIGLHNTAGGQRRGRGMAIAGLVLGIVWLVLAALLFLWIPIFWTVGASESHAFVSALPSNNVAIDDLQVGNCVIDPSDDFDEDTLPVVPCEQPHEGEVYAVFSLTGTRYPGDAAVDRRANGVCDGRLDDYVGRSAATSVQWDYDDYTPSADTWRDGDRVVVCVLSRADADPLIGSVRGGASVQD